VAVKQVDLGACRGVVHDCGVDRWAILLPGANYTPDAPLLWFAREVALAARRNVLAVVDTYERDRDASAWVDERAEAALRHAGSNDRPLLVAKSLTSLAAPLAARLGLPAIWLTPLIGRGGTSVSDAVVEGLTAATAPFLLVGGTSDPSWDGDIARSFPKAEVLELPGADHALQVPSDVARSLDALRTVVEGMSGFVDRLAGGRRPVTGSQRP
jgi:hypothetical protein